MCIRLTRRCPQSKNNVFNNKAWCWHSQQTYGYWAINQEQGLPIVKNLLIKTSKVISREPRILEYYWGSTNTIIKPAEEKDSQRTVASEGDRLYLAKTISSSRKLKKLGGGD
jgi:hypothetical protein